MHVTLPYPNIGTELPLGNDAFQSLRTDGSIYIDKTDMIFEITKFKKVFLSRPRRFGKTLLVSTLETLFRDGLEYFQGARRLYRNGSYVDTPFMITTLWRQPAYPVVRLDFSFLKDCHGDVLEEVFRRFVVRSFGEIGFTLRAGEEIEWLDVLRRWILSHTPSSLVLLIDEYDAGLGSRLNDGQEFSRMLSLLSSFFTMVKAANNAWRFVFITGIARFGKASIFSAMNDLVDITFDSAFGTLLGYTEQEIRENFAPYLEKAAKQQNNSVDLILDGMRRHYDGFCFDEEASTHVYAPWSVLNFLGRAQKEFKNYWAESSGSPSSLMTFLESSKGEPKLSTPEFIVSFEDLKSIMSLKDLKQELLLNQTGYLSILKIKRGNAILGTPNLEVAVTLARLYMSKLLPQNSKKANNNLPDVSDTLDTADPSAWISLVNAYFSRISYDHYPVDDESTCRALVQMIILGRGIDCTVEQHNAWGRSDLQVGTEHVYWLMEFKFVGKDETDQNAATKKALLDAIKQVKDRKYAKDVTGSNLIRMGLVFSERKRQITQWEVVPINPAD